MGEVNQTEVVTALECRASAPCRPGMLYKDALSGKVFAYVGMADLYSPTFSETDGEWIALTTRKETEN